jgi:hypothetical protein
VKGGKMIIVENISVKKINFTCPSSFRKLNIEENMYVLVFPLFHLVYIGSVGLATQPHQLLAKKREAPYYYSLLGMKRYGGKEREKSCICISWQFNM